MSRQLLFSLIIVSVYGAGIIGGFETVLLLITFFFVALFMNAVESEKKELEYQELYEKFDEITHRVEIEEHNEQYYWYDKDDNQFLAQGKTLEEITEKLKKYFPDHMFFIENQKEKVIHIISAPDWQMKFHRELE